jgi:hypothetical protein
MKKNILFFAITAAFLLAGFNRISAQCLPGWSHFMPVTVSAPGNPGLLTNFQAVLSVNTATLVAGGQMQANGDDIRFVDSLCNPIPYYIESGMNTATTKIWVKIPWVPAGVSTHVYMYFGNPAATPASNGDQVFLFFDDFNDGLFDQNKWEIRGTFATINETGGLLTLSGSNNWEYIRSKTSFYQKVVIDEAHQIQTTGAGLVLGSDNSDYRFTFRDNGSNLGVTYDPDVSGSNSWFNINWPAVNTPLGSQNSYTVVAEPYGSTINVLSYCNNTFSNCNNNLLGLSGGPNLGFFVGFSSWDNSNSIYADRIWVREYSSVPVFLSPGTMQSLTNVVVDSVSDLLLCPGESFDVVYTASGTFNPGNVFTVELSDANGDFALPSVLSTLTQQNAGTYTANCVVPPAAVAGTAYRIRVTASDPVLTGADNGQNIAIGVQPSVNLGHDIIQCESAGPVLLDAGNPGMYYLWSTGDTTQTVSIDSCVILTVTVYTLEGCTDSDTIIVTMNPDPQPDLGSDTIHCATLGPLVYDLFSPAWSYYSWNTGDNTASLTISSDGQYHITVTDLGGCTGSDTVQVSIIPAPILSISLPADTACIGNLLPVTVSPAGGIISGPGIYGTDFYAANAGTGLHTIYFTYTDSLGCTAVDSTQVYVDLCTGIESTESIAPALYPNPSSGILNYSFPFYPEGATMSICDHSGRIIYSRRVFANEGIIDLSHLSQGIYFLLTTYQNKISRTNFSIVK